MDSREVLTRPAPPPAVVVAYGEHPDQVADVRWPEPAPPLTTDAEVGAERPGPEVPLVVVLHGGFWRQEFDRGVVAPLCADLARHGLATAAVEYRRTGGAGGWPGTFDDVAAALDHVPSLVAAAAMPTGLRLQPQHVLMGHSAGGHLALWAAGRHRLPASSPWHREHADRSVSGVLGLAAVAALAEAAAEGLDGDAAERLVGAAPDELASRWAQADPVGLVPTGIPTVLVHGTDDDRVPVTMSHTYADAAREAGDSPELRVLRGVDHFALIDPLAEAWPEVLAALVALLGDASPRPLLAAAP